MFEVLGSIPKSTFHAISFSSDQVPETITNLRLERDQRIEKDVERNGKERRRKRKEKEKEETTLVGPDFSPFFYVELGYSYWIN